VGRDSFGLCTRLDEELRRKSVRGFPLQRGQRLLDGGPDERMDETER
jgi:hypothetical protein